MSSLRPELSQNIILDGRESAHIIHGFEVRIAASTASALGEVEAGSNKVKITPITNQHWDLPPHHGKIVASNSSYLSYVLEGRNGFVLRLLDRKTNSRALLKGFVGAIVDVAFCHSKSNLLACIDQGGNLYIWDLDLATDEAQLQRDALKIVVQRCSTPELCEHHLVWSPHVSSPDEEEEEDQDICNIVITHGNIAEVLDVNCLFSSHPNGTLVQREDLNGAIVSIMNAHEDDILDVSLSPDASVLATASKDGHLKFWQVNLDEDELPKCLHDIVPHRGAPVSRLLFCDNHLCQDPGNQYWRFLITASDHNTEVKIWCTVDWKCLQTIRFSPPEDGGADDVMPHVLLNLDLSASYLIAADSKRKVFQVLQLMSNVAEGDASFTSVTEYLLTQPIMSFVVCSCVALPVSTDSEGDSGDEEDEREASKKTVFDSRTNVALIELHCVHTRSMQQLLLRFEPPGICGDPPSHEEAKLKMPTPRPVSLGSEPASSHDIMLPSPTHQQPASLPCELMGHTASPSNTAPFQSLNITHSPKLLTPSEFTVAAKPLLDIGAIPLLSPATIMASAKLPKDESSSSLQQEWNTVSDSAGLGGELLYTLASSQSEASLVPGASAGTLSHSLHEDQVYVDEVTPEHGADAVDATVELSKASVSSIHSKNPAEGLQPQGCSSQEEDEPTGEVVQGDVFELLKADPPNGMDLSNQSFEQFAELLSHPEKLQEKRKALEECMEGDPLDEEALGGVELGDKLTASSLVAASEPSLVLSQPKLEGEPDAAELPDWPVVKPEAVVKEVPFDIEERCGSASPTSEAHSVKSEVSAEPSSNISKSSPVEFVMPSALTDHHTAWSGEDVEVPSILPQPSDNAKDANKTKKSRRKGKKAKKAAGQVPLGGTEERTSDVEVVPVQPPAVATDTWPAAKPPAVATDTWPAVATDTWPAVKPPAVATDTWPAVKPTAVATDTWPAVKPPAVATDTWPAVKPTAVATDTWPAVKPPAVATDTWPAVKPTAVATDTWPAVKPTAVATDTWPAAKPPAVATDTWPAVKPPAVATDTWPAVKPPAVATDTWPAVKPPAVATDTWPAVKPPAVATATSPGPDYQLLLSQLSQVMAEQKEMLCKMETAQQESFTALQSEMHALKESLVEEQKAVLAEFKRDQQQKMERLIKERQGLDKQKQDRLISAISQTLTTAVNTKLDKLIKTEMRATAIPAIKESVSSVREELSNCVSRCMNQTDVAIRDGVGHLVKSKDLSEAIGNAVIIFLQGSFPAILDNIFKNSLLTPIEKSLQVMFRQIDETFRTGTMDYLMQLQQQQSSVQDPMLQQIAASVHALQSTIASPQNSPMTAHIQATIHHEVAAFSQRIQENVIDAVSTIVHKEVGLIVDMQIEAQSQQSTVQDKKVQVCDLIQSHDYNAAFELALSTSDLDLVFYTCQQVDPDVIFEMTPFPLSQPVLLSLIQQLSMNLMENLDMKIRYLEQSVLAMNVEDEVTKSHMVPVMKQLSQQLQLVQKEAASNPSAVTPALLKQARQLLKVIQHVSR